MTRKKHPSGFVYVWMDKKHRRYYIGSHWGPTDDGYVCSSTWMRNSYKRRPLDFKRRVIKVITTNKFDLHEAEHRFLQMIKKEELGKRYYNLCNTVKNHWCKYEGKVLTVGQKISASKSYISEETRAKMRSAALGKKRIFSEEHRENIALAQRGKKKKKTGPRSEEVRLKISEAQRGKKRTPYSDERRKEISERLRREWNDGTRKRKNPKLAASKTGRSPSEETKKKISVTLKGRSFGHKWTSQSASEARKNA